LPAPERVMIGVVIGHGGRAPGSHIFRAEVEELERRGHLVIATDCHMAGPEDPVEEARSFDAAGTGTVDLVWDAINFVKVAGPARLFQQGVHDDVVPYEAARALYDAAPEPKEWREYDCDHGVDGHSQARLDRYAFLERVLG